MGWGGVARNKRESDHVSLRFVFILTHFASSRVSAWRKGDFHTSALRKTEETHIEENFHAGVQQRRVQVIVGFLQDGHKVGSLCAASPPPEPERTDAGLVVRVELT